MNPTAMALLLTSGLGLFAWSMARRMRLLLDGAARRSGSGNDTALRWKRLLVDGLLQKRLRQYRGAGIAHSLVFFGFVVLLLRTLTLFGRGFHAAFDLPGLGREGPLHGALSAGYNEVKDIATALVLLAVGYFGVQRLVKRPPRLTLSWEGLIILAVIGVMMIADTVYDGTSLVLANTWDGQCSDAAVPGCARMAPLVSAVGWRADPIQWRAFPDPLGSLSALVLEGLSTPALTWLAYVGFWSHSVLVLAFLNWLPYSKHFHIISALPNVYLASTEPGGKLTKLASDPEDLLEQAEALQGSTEPGKLPLGVSSVADLNWKYRLDLLSCTECGRCTEHCPAHAAGKPLSPKQLTLDLRGAMLRRGLSKPLAQSEDDSEGRAEALVPTTISAETLWSCTACRACEEQCPVAISYVDKIVDLRRDLVLMRGEVPNELQRAFDGIEHAGNPWGLPRADRTAWANGLGVNRLADVEQTDVLYWVGCAASYDQRAQKVARALVALLQRAKVDFAILGDEENCTGDAARRAGNEYLFLQVAQGNIATLNRYYEQKRFRRIVTACPHCLTTIKHEYPDFGGSWPILHHQQLLLELVHEGRLRPTQPVRQLAVLHDPCTLARYANEVIAPRSLLRSINGLSLTEAPRHGRFTRCCGAGGARAWLDDAPSTRMNVVRTQELQQTGAESIVTACPFCTTMIDDAAASLDDVKQPRVVDISELLSEACGLSS
jgi:Fe-S oxidoreductase